MNIQKKAAEFGVISVDDLWEQCGDGRDKYGDRWQSEVCDLGSGAKLWVTRHMCSWAGCSAVEVCLVVDGERHKRYIEDGGISREKVRELAFWFAIQCMLLSKTKSIKIERRYMELLYQVYKKTPGESRHQSALRILRSAHSGEIDDHAASCASEVFGGLYGKSKD